MESTYRKILKLSNSERKPLLARMVKLQEESGELAVAILKEQGWKGMGSVSKKANKENILEEAVDTIIIAMSIIVKYKFSEKEMEKMFSDKLEKWKKVIKQE